MGQIETVEEDKVDSNENYKNDGEDGERDCVIVDYNDLQEQNVDKVRLEDLVVLPEQRVPRSWRQDTFPLEDEYVSTQCPE